MINILKSDLDNNTIVKKYDGEFNSSSQIVVQQSQEAVLFYSGVAKELYTPGNYKLNTDNILLLGNVINKNIIDETPFFAEIYFVNKTELMGIKWGTPESFVVYENINGNKQPFKVTARGEMSIKVCDSQKLIEKIVGTESELSKDKFVDYLFDIIVTQIKTTFSTILSMDKYELYSIDMHLAQLGEQAQPLLNEKLMEYGVGIGMFNVSNVKLPEDDVHFQEYTRMKSTATIFGNKDIDIELERRDKLKEVEFNGIEENWYQTMGNDNKIKCPICSRIVPDGKFCNECGSPL